jgi:RNA polymerase sigma-70 factor (ECF subfamily)
VIDDAELISQCKNGSKEAFGRLAKKYYNDVYSVAYYWLEDRDAAYDISQEAFIRAFRNIKNFNQHKPFKGWLYIIIKNLCVNYMKRYRKRRIVFTDYLSKTDSDAATFPDLVTHPENSEKKEILWWGIRQLNKSEKEIVLLRDIEEFSYKEVSDILNIPLGTVMSRLYHARKNLAYILREYRNDE